MVFEHDTPFAFALCAILFSACASPGPEDTTGSKSVTPHSGTTPDDLSSGGGKENPSSSDPPSSDPPDEDAGDYEGDPRSCDPVVVRDLNATQRFSVGQSDYEGGEESLGDFPFSMSVPLRARVYYPAKVEGMDGAPVEERPMPVMIMLHGNHPLYRTADGDVIDCEDTLLFDPDVHLASLREIQDEFPGATPVESHLGYEYLGRRMAAVGVIFVSIDGAMVNCVNSEDGFVPARRDLIRRHLELLTDIDSLSGIEHLQSAFDLERLVIAGHSRGAEAALLAGATSLPVVPRGILAVAPTTYLFEGQSWVSSGSTFVVLPAADGDVSFNGGLLYYDTARPAEDDDVRWFKAQHYVHGANHNFFNARWNEPLEGCDGVSADGDNGQQNGEERLLRSEQEAYLSYASRLFLQAVLDDDVRARSALAGNAVLMGQEGVLIASSFQAGGTVEVPLDAMTSGFESLEAYPFSHRDQAYNDTFFHATEGLIGQYSQTDARLTLSAPSNEGANRPDFLRLRMAQVVDAVNEPAHSLAMDVMLEDTNGRTVSAGSDWAGATIPSWYARPPWKDPSNDCQPTMVEKTVLSTMEIPITCFDGESAFDFSNIASIHLKPRQVPGLLAVTEVQFTSEGQVVR